MAMTEREKMLRRMLSEEETRPLRENMMNTQPASIGAEYPKMLYRKTNVEEKRVVSQDKNGKDREWEVLNNHGGYLCDTIVAESADEAEALSADGWDVSPAAAHGQASGLVAATTAKDERIAELEAQLAAMQGGAEGLHSAPVEPVRRGPGRPPRQPEAEI